MTQVGFVDAEELTRAFLLPLMVETGFATRIVTELPANFEKFLPLIQVERIAGPDTVPSLDNPTLDVEAFAADRPAAKHLADRIRIALRYGMCGFQYGGAVVSAVTTIQGPGWRPYSNTTMRRVGATYGLSLHSQQ